ncbi:hypothetical protein JANAI62_03580 [Jannaschia pagri]|uniref:Uncharacterized protein n=1 Tax=Jannaschia pagri TaxID=2829797 RepID=A0ABQ4NHT0_9RHOB|nr:MULTISPECIES: hypothetical protein [unclassified Jannaschia]GIT90159.1 hypothetical protein JANAI61_06170 [Jannaschia sp. AI_61]GIT93735.1 hypothetical protein JANAI62_03580 [Jannaschia sp. AI_62]
MADVPVTVSPGWPQAAQYTSPAPNTQIRIPNTTGYVVYLHTSSDGTPPTRDVADGDFIEPGTRDKMTLPMGVRVWLALAGHYDDTTTATINIHQAEV